MYPARHVGFIRCCRKKKTPMQPQNNLKTPVIMELILRPKNYFLQEQFQVGNPYYQVYQTLCESLPFFCHFVCFSYHLALFFSAYDFLIIRGILNVSNVVLKSVFHFSQSHPCLLAHSQGTLISVHFEWLHTHFISLPRTQFYTTVHFSAFILGQNLNDEQW